MPRKNNFGSRPERFFTNIWLLTSALFLLVKGSSSVTRDVTCLLKQKSWIQENYLLITWKLPENVFRHENLSVSAVWYREHPSGLSNGTCGETTPTSCKLYYGDENSPRPFDRAFNLTVVISAGGEVLYKKTHLFSYAESCRQPPPVGQVSTSPLNSSCLNVTWGYLERQNCNDRVWKKAYRIRYRQVNKHDSWLQFLQNKSKETCTGIAVICGLRPFTVYEVGVECRGSNGLNEETGWSEPSSLMVKTMEDVPSATPEVTASGFSYTQKDCVNGGTRTVTMYWKTLPDEFAQGILRGYQVSVFRRVNLCSQKLLKQTDLDKEAVSFTTEFQCSSSYIMFLKAFTVKGSSENSSTIVIPRNDGVLDEAVDVIPTVREANTDIIVSWLFHRRPSVNITSLTLFWCLKTLDGRCHKHLNWTSLSPDAHYFVLKAAVVPYPVYKYKIGISVESSDKSSGIIWSPCLYGEDIDLRPPRNVRLRTVEDEGAFAVEWDNLACGGGLLDPYISGYIIHLCVLKNTSENTCSNTIWSKEVTRLENSVVFSQLDTSQWYGVYVVAETRTNISRQSELITGRPFRNEPTMTTLLIVVLVSVAVIVFVLMSTGIATVLKGCIGMIWRRFKEPMINDPLQGNEFEREERRSLYLSSDQA